MWQTIPLVSTIFSLVAFISAILLIAYMSRLKARSELVKNAPEAERVKAIAVEAEFFDVDIKGIPVSKQTIIILEQIRNRGKRDLYLLIIIVVLAFLSAAVAIFYIFMSGPNFSYVPKFLKEMDSYNSGMTQNLSQQDGGESKPPTLALSGLTNTKSAESSKQSMPSDSSRSYAKAQTTGVAASDSAGTPEKLSQQDSGESKSPGLLLSKPSSTPSTGSSKQAAPSNSSSAGALEQAKDVWNDPPNNTKQHFGSYDCDGTLWYSSGTGWTEILPGTAAPAGSLFSLLWYGKREPLGGLKITIQSRTAPKREILSVTKVVPWSIERWPDGGKIDRCDDAASRKYGFRINFRMPTDTPPGEYWYFYGGAGEKQWSGALLKYSK